MVPFEEQSKYEKLKNAQAGGIVVNEVKPNKNKRKKVRVKQEVKKKKLLNWDIPLSSDDDE